eukprot:2437834-Pyramimonas_sp.AAC.1
MRQEGGGGREEEEEQQQEEEEEKGSPRLQERWTRAAQDLQATFEAPMSLWWTFRQRQVERDGDATSS